MGRNRKPLSEQNGNLTRKIIDQKQREEQLLADSTGLGRTPPDWVMKGEARKIWKDVYPELSRLGIICVLDSDNLGGFCNAAAQYRKATKELETAPLVIEGKTGLVENPLVNTQRKYAQEMRDFAGKCGLTIDSRLKFAAGKTKTEDEMIAEDFGDI